MNHHCWRGDSCLSLEDIPIRSVLNHWYDSSLSTGSVLARASYNSQTKLLLLVELLENLSDDEESASKML